MLAKAKYGTPAGKCPQRPDILMEGKPLRSDAPAAGE